MKRILTGIISAGITIGVIAAWIIWSNSSFEETFYAMESYKIEETVRVIVLADLHQRSFGPDNETLLGRVRALRPDLLLIAGDLVNKGNPDWDYAVGLCRELAEIAPVYYAMGNHENEALYGQDLNKKFLDGAALGPGGLLPPAPGPAGLGGPGGDRGRPAAKRGRDGRGEGRRGQDRRPEHQRQQLLAPLRAVCHPLRGGGPGDVQNSHLPPAGAGDGVYSGRRH